MALKPNLRKGNKYAEAREWAYDLIANSTETRSTDMADMMAEQFGLPRSAMLNTLGQMARVGILKVVGDPVYKGKRAHVLAANKRRSRIITPEPPLVKPEPPVNIVPPLVTNGAGVYVVVETAEGPVKLTVEQAKFFADKLAGFLK